MSHLQYKGFFCVYILKNLSFRLEKVLFRSRYRATGTLRIKTMDYSLIQNPDDDDKNIPFEEKFETAIFNHLIKF